MEQPTSEYIREWATYTPDKIALSFYGRDIPYRELNSLIDRTAWGLVDLGVKKGDRAPQSRCTVTTIMGGHLDYAFGSIGRGISGAYLRQLPRGKVW